jgi:23S rRNA pseudouridine2605 synthase
VVEGPRAGTGERPQKLLAGERLQKVLAGAGIGSRRSCEQMILAGRVSVNGEIARIGQRAVAGVDRILVDGVPLPSTEVFTYYLVNKPAGVVSSAPGREVRKSVVKLVPPVPRVFPVGRLDVATEGALVLTNDGELAYRLAHPKFGVDKEYIARVVSPISREAVNRLRRGVRLADGVTAPARVTLLGPYALRIVVHEGRNRQVRRMLEAVGNRVVSLTRTRIGPIGLRGLAPGQWRPLSPVEVRSLWEAAAAGAPSGPQSGAQPGARAHGPPAPPPDNRRGSAGQQQAPAPAPILAPSDG